VGRAEIRSGEQSPPCPKCKATSATALARDLEKARFQCACGELFIVPASQVPVRPDAAAPAPTTSTPRATLPADFSSVEYCDKGCGQSFRWPPAKVMHEKTCEGSAETETGAEEPKEETVASNGKLVCRKGCGKEFNREAWREKHEDGCTGSSTKKAPRAEQPRPKREQPNTAGARRGGHVLLAIQELEAKREEFARGIQKIDEILPRLKDLAAELDAIDVPPATDREAS
jgi:hypothetical protein